MLPAAKTTGSPTVKVLAELEPVFPRESLCSACAVYVPGFSGALARTEYAPPVPRAAVSVWSGVPVGLEPG